MSTTVTPTPVLTPSFVIAAIEDAIAKITRREIRATLARLEEMLTTASRRPYILVDDFINLTDAADSLYAALRFRVARTVTDAISVLQRAVAILRGRGNA